MDLTQVTGCSNKECSIKTETVSRINVIDGECKIRTVNAENALIGEITIPKDSMAFISAFVNANPDNNSGIVSFKVFFSDEKDGSTVFSAVDGVSKITDSNISISHICETKDKEKTFYLFAKIGSSASVTPVNFRALYIQDLK